MNREQQHPTYAQWRLAFLIRAFEERLLSLFAEGRLQGTVHTCSGQEWSALAVAGALRQGDVVLSNHRGHGHFLARNPDMLQPLLAEIMGLAEGLCGGVGGSQHLYADGFYSNGVQGGMTPIAAGLALAQKLRGDNGVTAVFIGDGTTGEGILYEAMTLAAIWRLPLIFVLERNGYAQSTNTQTTLPGDMKKRAEGFGLSYHRGNIWNNGELCAIAKQAVEQARSGSGAILLEIDCFRLNAHSKGDDNRPADIMTEYRARDPLAVFSREQPEEAKQYADEADTLIAKALAAVSGRPCTYSPQPNIVNEPVQWLSCETKMTARHGEKLHAALSAIMADENNAIILGEDIAAPYGGSFKITRNLSDLYPDRVLNTSISEAGIVGVGTGLALGGFKPIVEIMFGDFLTLVLDQLQQHAAKFAAMSNGRVKVPLIVRSPSGGRRGYGPTHSQSLEKHFLGIPGLNVVALNQRIEPAQVYKQLLDAACPTLVIENKVLYGRIVPPHFAAGYAVFVSDEACPTIRISPENGIPDVTIACYGGMLEQVEATLAKAFQEDEILCEIICPTRLHPFNPAPLLASLTRTRRLLTVEEGPGFAGWGSELAAQAAYAGIALKQVKRLSYDGLIPASAQREADLLPDSTGIHSMLRDCMANSGSANHV